VISARKFTVPSRDPEVEKISLKRRLIVHAATTAVLLVAGILLLGTSEPSQIWRSIGGHLTTFVVSALAAATIVLAGRRPSAGDIGLAAMAGLIFVNAMMLTYAPLVMEGLPQFGTLNWTGKLMSLGYVGVTIAALPPSARQAAGLASLPQPDSRRFCAIMLALFALGGIGLAFADVGSGDPVEAALFQLSVPSLSEELLFRSVLLCLLAGIGAEAAAGLPPRFGRAAIATSVLFGLVHGFVFSPPSEFFIEPVAIIATGLFGAAFAWLTIRVRSVWPAVLAHSLLNATGPLLRLAGAL
jgi:hypothetical protein